MADLSVTVDPQKVEPATGPREPIPKGWYPLTIHKSDAKPNSKGNGQVAYFYPKVLDGPHEGRTFLVTMNTVHHDSPEAQRIGQAQLSALAWAVGWTEPVTNTSELEGQPFMGLVDIEESNGTDKNGKPYPPKNVIRDFKSEDKFRTEVMEPGKVDMSTDPPYRLMSDLEDDKLGQGTQKDASAASGASAAPAAAASASNSNGGEGYKPPWKR